MDGTDPWSVLEVDPSASPAELKTAFRRRCLECHPDRGGDAVAFGRLQAAYRRALAASESVSASGATATRRGGRAAAAFDQLATAATAGRRLDTRVGDRRRSATVRPATPSRVPDAGRAADALAFSRALDQALRAA